MPHPLFFVSLYFWINCIYLCEWLLNSCFLNLKTYASLFFQCAWLLVSLSRGNQYSKFFKCIFQKYTFFFPSFFASCTGGSVLHTAFCPSFATKLHFLLLLLHILLHCSAGWVNHGATGQPNSEECFISTFSFQGCVFQSFLHSSFKFLFFNLKK